MASCVQQQNFLSQLSSASMMSSLPAQTMISPLSQDMTSPITSPTGSGDIEIPMSLSSTSLTPAVSSQPYTAANLDNLFSNGLSGQMEINKQLMECLTVALDEIRELRKQLAERSENSSPANTPSPTIMDTPMQTPSPSEQQDMKKESSLSPSPMPSFEQSPAMPTMDWSVLQTAAEASTTHRGKRCRSDKSHVPAACRSIVKNVYRELVRRSSINAFDLHQGQESSHNVMIYWKVIEHIKKTNASCSWGDVDMLYAIRTYWRSLRDDRQRELSGKKYNHRRMIIRREIMKRKLKSRQKAIALVSWVPELREHVTETLNLDYMSSEEEDNTVECREGPRPRVVRRLAWESELMTKCKEGLDLEFRKICSARQLKATAHVYRRPDVVSSRVKPAKCPAWAADPTWDPESINQPNTSLNFSDIAPSMLPISQNIKELSFHNNSVQSYPVLNSTQLQSAVLNNSQLHSAQSAVLNNSQLNNSQLQNTLLNNSQLQQSPLPSSLSPPSFNNLNLISTQSILYPLTSLTSLTPNTETTETSSALPMAGITTAMTSQDTTSQNDDKAISQSVLQSLSDTDRKLVDSIVETLSASNPLVKDMNPLDVLLSLNSSYDVNSMLAPQ